jgi:transmembrane sensor
MKDKQESTDMRIATEAAEWLLRVEDDQSVGSRAEFAAWLRHSPRHMEEFLMLSATAGALRGVDAERSIDVEALLRDSNGNVVALQDGVDHAPRAHRGARRKRNHLIPAAIAATLIVGIILSFVYLRDGIRFTTAVGEQRTVQMEDGSVVHLNTRSRIRIDYSDEGRDISLLEGEALFVVARDPARPFRVSAGSAVIQAVGTQFNVYRRENETTVSVVEGRVKIGTAPALGAGEQVKLTGDGLVLDRAQADVSTAVAWRQLRLVFKSQRLDEVAAEFNRYNHVPIRVEGAAAERRMTGTFNANETEGFLQFLRRDESLDVESMASEVVVRIHARDSRP